MKTFVVTCLFLACVTARGSGPYLPSGWKPDGPVFYLPSEVTKPLGRNIKEIIFGESEASGTDFLREYGPPSVVGIQDISLQGLPGLSNEKIFVETVVETNGVKDNSNFVTEVTEDTLVANVKVKAGEASVTESQLVTETESFLNDEDINEVKIETTTSVSAAEQFGYEVEPTVAIVVPTEIINVQTNEQYSNQVIEESLGQEQQTVILQQDTEKLVSKVEESTTQVNSGIQPSNSVVGGQTDISTVQSSVQTTTTQQADIKVDVISTVEEKVETIEEEVKRVEKVVQNIPELIVSLGNEIKSQQVKTIQEEPAVVTKSLGPLELIPEGFLEYGPPGFREYGPPEETLADKEKITLPQSIENNQLRRRRFSPKYRVIYKIK